MINMSGYQPIKGYEFSLNNLFAEDQRLLSDEIDSIEHQIAQRERIKKRNTSFLEFQRQKIEEQLNQAEFFGSGYSWNASPVRARLLTQMVQLDLKKGEEYVLMFRDIQRLEEQKRKLLEEQQAGELSL